MGGPYYVLDACITFKCNEELLPEIHRVFRDEIAPSLDLAERDIEIPKPFGEPLCFVGFDFEPIPTEADDGRMMILFKHSSPHQQDDRYLRAAEILKERFPGIDAEAEFQGESW